MAKEDWVRIVQEWVSHWFNQIIVSIIILLIGFIIARMIKKMVYHLLHELEVDELLFQITNIQTHTEEYLSNMLVYIVYVITVIIALMQLGITSLMVYTILGIILVLLILVTLWSLKDVIPNSIAGIKMSKKRVWQENSIIQVGKIKGKIMRITLLDTHLKTENGDLILIPHTTLLKEKVTVLQTLKKTDHIK